MRSRLNEMLDNVEWEKLQGLVNNPLLPYTTHKGVLEVNGVKFRVYQLSNGKRIIDGEDISNFLGL